MDEPAAGFLALPAAVVIDFEDDEVVRGGGRVGSCPLMLLNDGGSVGLFS